MEKDSKGIELRQISNILGRVPKVFVQAPRFALRVQARVLGSVAGRYIVIRSAAASTEAGLSALSLKVGDDLVVRLFVDGIAYGFTSSVLYLFSQPEPLVFVRYPEEVEQINIRQYERLLCSMPCVFIDTQGKRNPALLLDISAMGCKVAYRVCAEESSERRRPVKLELILPSPEGLREGEQEIAGKIIRLSKRKEVADVGLELMGWSAPSFSASMSQRGHTGTPDEKEADHHEY